MQWIDVNDNSATMNWRDLDEDIIELEERRPGRTLWRYMARAHVDNPPGDPNWDCTDYVRIYPELRSDIDEDIHESGEFFDGENHMYPYFGGPKWLDDLDGGTLHTITLSEYL